MVTKKIEFYVGAFICLSIFAFIILVFNMANLSVNSDKTYLISARFDNIGSLKLKAPVKVGGVKIGRVTDITLDTKDLVPVVSIAIADKYKFTKSSSLSVQTSGVLGEQYLKLTPGFSEGPDDVLKEGSVIHDTNSALVLEDLIGKFLYSKNKG